MHILAGTSRGVFGGNSNHWSNSELRHDCGSVREIVRLGKTLYAGASNGVHASTDDGATWFEAGLQDHAVWQIRELGDGRLLAGTQPAGLFVTEPNTASPGGALNWVPVTSFSEAPGAAEWCVPVDPPMPAAARAIVIDRTDPTRICAGVEVGGIMQSLDAGNSWTPVLPGDNPDIHMLFQHPAKPEVLFVSTGYGRLDGIAPMEEGNAGVFYSADFGGSWEYRWRGIQPRYSRPMCIDERAPHALTVASAPTAFSNYKEPGGAGAMLFRSDDEGLSWHSLCDSAHSPSAANFHGLTVDPEVNGGVIVGTDTGEIWRVSADAQWQLVADGLPAVRALCAW